MRAYELARVIGVTSKELLVRAEELGLPIKNQLKAVTEEHIRALWTSFVSSPPPGATVTPEPPPEIAAILAKEAPPEAPPEETAKPEVAEKPREEKPEEAEKPREEKAEVEEPTREPEAPAVAEEVRKPEAPAAEPAAESVAEPAAEAEPKKPGAEPTKPQVEAPTPAPETAPSAEGVKEAEVKKVKEVGEVKEVRKVEKPAPAAAPAAETKAPPPSGEPRRRRRRPRPIGRVGGVPTVQAPTPPTAVPTRRVQATRRTVPVARKKPVAITFPLTLREFSSQIGVKANQIIARLLRQGTMKSINDLIDEEEGVLLAEEFGVTVEVKKEADLEEELLAADVEDRPEDLRPRAPVVTLMGHVDHGKTSLLDRIRQSNIAEGEYGGITQHIGAYQVRTNEHTIVFLDTPGHEAFTAMRARGAQVTDLVVLVVAADDGVMPQTEEAISHARAAGVPIVVAINKVDRPDANPQRVKQQLAGLGLMPEEWGGETVMVETSAVTGQGVDTLLEMLALEAELLELRANPDKPARGVVLEARLTAGRGVVATVLVQEGTLRVGDVVLCGESYGRIRSLTDDRGQSLQEAGPSTPVEVTGLTGVPEAGDKMYVLEDIQKAKEIASERERRRRMAQAVPRRHVTLEDLRAQVEAGKRKELAVVLKADVQGSVEVVREQLEKLSTEEVRLDILHAAVGDVTEGDVLLADASDAVIIGFNVEVDPQVAAEARQRGVEVRLYRVIYELTDEMHRALEGMLEPERREVSLGEAEVRQVFRISRVGTVAGCLVTRGVIRRNARVRLRRGEEVLFDGTLESLRRFKNDVSEVAEGYECGMRLAGFNDIQEGDRIEAYTVEEVARTL